MGQITLYMDEKTLSLIEKAAKKEHCSISKWAKQHLVNAIEKTWPADYFKLFGSLDKIGLERPTQPDWDADANREIL